VLGVPIEESPSARCSPSSVLVLCYATAREKRFDADQAAGLNDLVLGYALPASLFVGAVRTPREQFLQDVAFVLALFFAFVAFISSRSGSAAWGFWR
jgi:predicted permease